jgi:hypothetical protein
LRRFIAVSTPKTRSRERYGGIGQKVFDYFSALRLPDTPTIYDYLLLALRPKDLIATFNWDPFLFQAFLRNRRFTDALPRLSFLHGNVTVGYSAKDQRAGPVGMRSRATGDEFVQTPLLYPVTHKDYNQSEFITHEWERLKVWLEGAKRFTIFGYGAPVTDVEVVDLMSSAWGNPGERNMEQIEIIDIQPKETLADRWGRFIHTHHYECFNNYFQSSLASFPRRTGSVLCINSFRSHLERSFRSQIQCRNTLARLRLCGSGTNRCLTRRIGRSHPCAWILHWTRQKSRDWAPTVPNF